MKSVAPGPSTSPVEVTNVSPHGFWLFVGERELFVSFKEFPWFQESTVRALANVELPSPQHLYWPELDVDLALESIEHPERFPLVSAVRPRSGRIVTPRRKASKRLTGAARHRG